MSMIGKAVVGLHDEVGRLRRELADLTAERDQLRRYVGGNNLRSDFRTVDEMRQSLEHYERLSEENYQKFLTWDRTARNLNAMVNVRDKKIEELCADLQAEREAVRVLAKVVGEWIIDDLEWFTVEESKTFLDLIPDDVLGNDLAHAAVRKAAEGGSQ